MKRQALTAFAVIALSYGAGSTQQSHAESYPSHPIKIIVPAGPGGPTDIPARFASQVLPATLGQPIVVENRPGAGGAIAMREVAKAPTDGYTLLSGGTAALAVIPALSANAGYDTAKDFAPVAKVMDAFQVLVVHPSAPWRSIRDLVSDARANPGKFNYAHIGTAHLTHLAGELFMARTGTRLVGVPYRSGPEAINAVLSGSVQLTFENVGILLPLIKDGKLRALAVTSPLRTEQMPELPTMMEAGVPDYEVTSFFGLVAPAGTPDPTVHALNAAINQALKNDETRAIITRLGAVPTPGSPDQFGAFIAAQTRKWKSIGGAAGVRIE